MRRRIFLTMVGAGLVGGQVDRSDAATATSPPVSTDTIGTSHPGGSQSIDDPRWTNLPGTETQFSPPHFPTLNAWKARREHLRRQILWTAGLWPLPERISSMKSLIRLA